MAYGNGSVSAGGPGMSPRKQMASGGGSSGFGVPSYPPRGAMKKTNPDRSGMTGEKGAMDEGSRAIGMPVAGGGDHHPRQAAPDHGPGHHKAMGNSYGGKA